MPVAYLLLGSNLGDRAAILQEAVQLLAAEAGAVQATSSLYETAAWGLEDQPAFLNQAVALHTSLPPEALLEVCLRTEQLAGRERLVRWGARTLDVDVLFYDDLVMDTERLTVPHPRLADRRFVLVPLAELAPDFVHPILNRTVTALLADCQDELPVQVYHS